MGSTWRKTGRTGHGLILYCTCMLFVQNVSELCQFSRVVVKAVVVLILAAGYCCCSDAEEKLNALQPVHESMLQCMLIMADWEEEKGKRPSYTMQAEKNITKEKTGRTAEAASIFVFRALPKATT
jgi:hypothetical protein